MIYCNDVFKGQSVVTFTNITAANSGGAVFCEDSNINFKENSSALFIGNIAEEYGGAIAVQVICNNDFNYNFDEETGGSMEVCYESNVTIEGTSVTKLSKNRAYYGGATYVPEN